MLKLKTASTVLACLLVPTGALAAQFLVGASIGAGYFAASSVSLNETAIGVPLIGPTLEFSPGLRFGVRNEDAQHEGSLDIGAAFTGASDLFSSRSLVVLGNYQLNLWPRATWGPYVAGGGGFGYFRYEDLSPAQIAEYGAVSAIAGASVGLARELSNGHGRLRAELRFDYVTEGRDGNRIVVPAGSSYSLRLGFDMIAN